MGKEILSYNRGYLEALFYRLSEEIQNQECDGTPFITELVLVSYLYHITKNRTDRHSLTGRFYFKKKIKN